MALSLNEKKNLVANVSQKINESNVLILVKYQGLDVGILNQLRTKSRAEGLGLKVIPNRLMYRALEGTKFQNLQEFCKGQLITMFANDNASIGARILMDFAKEEEKLVIISFSIESQVFSGKDIKILSSMPTRIEGITKVAILLKMPITKFARSLNEVPTKLVRVLAAIKNKK